MLWHVRLCIWLMLVTVLINSEEHLHSTQVPVKRNVRLDQVADFADVIEPEELVKEAEDSQEGFKVDMVQKREDESDTGSTLRVALSVTGDLDLYNKQHDPSLHARDDTIIGNQHKRSVPKKYTNLLDLKYYIAKGLPIRGHTSETMLYQNNNIGGIRNRNKRKNRSAKELGQKKRNNPLNIIPMMNEYNPYLSNLADATNDAYLKMRNYANTLMVILTTPRSNLQSQKQVIIKRPYDIVAKPVVQLLQNQEVPKPALQHTPPQVAEIQLQKLAGNNIDLKKPQLQKKEARIVKKAVSQEAGSSQQTISDIPDIKTTAIVDFEQTETPYEDELTNQGTEGTFLPLIRVPSSLKSMKRPLAKHTRSSTVHAKTAVSPITTQSPLSWENDLLKSADIKLRRSTPEEIYLLKSNKPKGFKDSIPIFNETNKLDMGNKMLTPEVPSGNQNTCVMTKNPETDYSVGCDETLEDEDDSGCIDLPNGSNNNMTCGDNEKNYNEKNIGNRRQVAEHRPAECEPPKNCPPVSSGGQASATPSSAEGHGGSSVDSEGNNICDKFFTVPVKDVQQHLDEAISGAIAPIKQLTDVKPYYPGKPDETDSTCVKDIMNSNSTEFPSVTLKLDTGMNKGVQGIDDECAPAGKGGGSGDSKTTKPQETTTISVAVAVVTTSNNSSSMSSSEKSNSEKLSSESMSADKLSNKAKASRKAMDHDSKKVSNPSQKEATVIESDYDDSAENTDDPLEQLVRLRRDLYVANQLKDLLGKITGDGRKKKADKREGKESTNDRNFRESQNSQSDEKPINWDIPPLNRSPIDYYDPNDEEELTNVDKRFLFRKRRRKKKKAKNVWKHIFGVRSDENRFLNQNFPNSQYAKYPV